MNHTSRRRLGRSLLAATAALTIGCAEGAPAGPAAPERAPALAARADRGDGRAVDLGACDSLQAPAGHALAYRVYAQGVQIYHWTGARWAFDGPSAVLTADAGGHGVVGTHYAGPTWESTSGSRVAGEVMKRCAPDPTAIPWLLLKRDGDAKPGPGRLDPTTFIQRIATTGGRPPSTSGCDYGVSREIPYTADYVFWKERV
jgi:FtsP/CotA-like multicopper oxidase with cupredoxin domain